MGHPQFVHRREVGHPPIQHWSAFDSAICVAWRTIRLGFLGNDKIGRASLDLAGKVEIGGWPTFSRHSINEGAPSFRVLCERVGTTDLDDKKICSQRRVGYLSLPQTPRVPHPSTTLRTGFLASFARSGTTKEVGHPPIQHWSAFDSAICVAWRTIRLGFLGNDKIGRAS